MIPDAVLIVNWVFTSVWRLGTSWFIPGTNVTPLGLAFFFLAASVILRILKRNFFGDDE